MRPFYTLLMLLAVVVVSCNKDLSYEGGYIPPVEPPVEEPPVLSDSDDFKEFLIRFNFQLRDFYSDIAIDFNEEDNQTLSEINLWHYVPQYLRDDINSFEEDGTVIIDQHLVKKSGFDDDILIRSYSIGEDANGVFIVFLDSDYNPLSYRVAEIGEDYFILSVEWTQGATLYSRFEIID